MATSGLWTLDACDGAGTKLTTLTRHQGTRLTFTRNGVPECELSLSHDDDECAAILTALANGTGGGVPTLNGYRTGPTGAKAQRFGGYLAGVSEESGPDASTATFTFRGVFGKLLGNGENRGRPLNADVFYPATDAGQIAKALIDLANAIGPTGVVTTGVIEPTKNRDRSYLRSQNVGEAVVALTQVLDGFDFEVDPSGVFTVYARQGSDKPAAKFEYGPATLANCSGLHRQMLPPINVSWVSGGNDLIGAVSNDPSVLKYGPWFSSISQPDVVEQQTLDDKAYALLRPDWVKVIDFTPEPRMAPSPWDDYWIGDTVRFYARRNGLVEGPTSVRVNQITVVIDPDTGLESSEIPDPVSDDEERVLRAGLQAEVV